MQCTTSHIVRDRLSSVAPASAARTTLHSHYWTSRTSAKPLTSSASAACLWSWCKSTQTEVHPPRFTVCTSAVCKARVTAGNVSPQGRACLEHLAAHGLVVASTALTSPSLSCARGLNSCKATRSHIRSLQEHLTATYQTADLGPLLPRVQQHQAAGSVKPLHFASRRKPRLIARKFETGTITNRSNTTLRPQPATQHLMDWKIANGY